MIINLQVIDLRVQWVLQLIKYPWFVLGKMALLHVIILKIHNIIILPLVAEQHTRPFLTMRRNNFLLPWRIIYGTKIKNKENQHHLFTKNKYIDVKINALNDVFESSVSINFKFITWCVIDISFSYACMNN